MAEQKEVIGDLSPERVDSWHDPAKHPETTMTPEEVQALLREGKELYFSHHTKDGWPMVTIHFYCLIDGEVWTTSVKGRVKVGAFKRDNRTCLCVSNGDMTMLRAQAVSIKARAEVIEDRETVRKVCRAKAERYFETEEARQKFFAALFTPNRVAIRFIPEKVVSWDISRLGRKQ